MKISVLINELSATMAEHGDVEVELQELNTNCDANIHVIPEKFKTGRKTKTIVKLRAWYV
jgi:hypothetical protein